MFVELIPSVGQLKIENLTYEKALEGRENYKDIEFYGIIFRGNRLLSLMMGNMQSNYYLDYAIERYLAGIVNQAFMVTEQNLKLGEISLQLGEKFGFSVNADNIEVYKVAYKPPAGATPEQLYNGVALMPEKISGNEENFEKNNFLSQALSALPELATILTYIQSGQVKKFQTTRETLKVCENTFNTIRHSNFC